MGLDGYEEGDVGDWKPDDFLQHLSDEQQQQQRQTTEQSQENRPSLRT